MRIARERVDGLYPPSLSGPAAHGVTDIVEADRQESRETCAQPLDQMGSESPLREDDPFSIMRSTDPLLFQSGGGYNDSQSGDLPDDLLGMPFPRYYERMASIQDKHGRFVGWRRRMVALEAVEVGDKGRNSREVVRMSDMARAGKSIWRESVEPMFVKRRQDQPVNIMLYDPEEGGRYYKGLGLENWVSERWVGDRRRWEREQSELRRLMRRRTREEYERSLRKVERGRGIRQGSHEILGMTGTQFKLFGGAVSAEDAEPHTPPTMAHDEVMF